jgi:hypothetical protein
MLNDLADFDSEISWQKLYTSWSRRMDRYPELAELARFEPVRWASRFYWGFDQPAQLIMSEEDGGVVHLDWWPRYEFESRKQALLSSEPHWNVARQPPAQASRYTLFYLWEAKNHSSADEAIAAVWLAACLGMWHQNLPEAWRGRFARVLEMHRYAALGRIEQLGIDQWSHPCRHLLPDSLADLFRKPEYDLDLMDMVAANIAYVHNRWTTVQLIPDPGQPRTERSLR